MREEDPKELLGGRKPGSPGVLAADPPLSLGPGLLLSRVLRLAQARSGEEEDYLF